jgi:hypothetical protein
MPVSTIAGGSVVDAQWGTDQHPFHNGMPATSECQKNHILKGELFSSPNQIAISLS